MSLRVLAVSAAVAVAASSPLVSARTSSATKKQLSGNAVPPDTGRDWFSLSPGGAEFQPAQGVDVSDPIVRRALRHYQAGNNEQHSPYDMQFIDGSETYYNQYAQAWRLIGFYIDCNAPQGDENECWGERDNDNDNEDENYQPPCQRYLMWAAYVDPNYANHGIGEYKFYDRHNKTWDDTSCIASDGRCAPMDCHLSETDFLLLGIFKEPNYHEWMEQLFKHEGVCIWTDSEYEFMQNDRQLWPCGCTNTYAQDEDGNYLYYDTKPMPEGRIGLGLYTDNRCSQDYDVSDDVLEIVLENYISAYGNNGGGHGNDDGSTLASLTVSDTIEKWNDAFDAFKVCQPCVAYNLMVNPSINEGARQGDYQNNDDAVDDDGEGWWFTCEDDAGYRNVNQCMKFRTKTKMMTVDFRDIMLAHEQGNIVEMDVMGMTYGKGGYRSRFINPVTTGHSMPVSVGSIAFLACSFVALLGGAFLLRRAKKVEKEASMASTMERPLMNEKAVMT